MIYPRFYSHLFAVRCLGVVVSLDLIDVFLHLYLSFISRLERALVAVLYFIYCCLLREDRHRDN